MNMPLEEILNKVLKSENLPTLPIVASKLITLTGREETTLTDIADLISKDMALSAKILKVSNSAFYSFPQQITSINQAVSILGTNAVRSLVLSFSFLSMKGKGKDIRFDFEQFWEQALAGGVAARMILAEVPGADSEEIFIAGLLQNIGHLILACTLPDLYNNVLSRLENSSADQRDIDIENEIIGADHAVIGAAVTQHWGFPESLWQPIRFHHNPDEFPGSDTAARQCLDAVFLSDLLVRLLYSDQPEEYHRRFRNEAKRRLGLRVLSINTILKKVHELVDQTAKDFGLKKKPSKSVEEILQEANLRLSMLNMSYEEMNRELVRSKMELEKLTRELAHKNKLLENLANIDGLTEINNHRFFQNFLDQEINRSTRNGSTISILLMDIDNFKKFNDTYGHQTGDFILKELCKVCKQELREYDLMARYGGEEFVVVLPETEPDEAMAIAERLRKRVEGYDFNDGKSIYHVTISIGVASARPSGKDFKKNEFIGLADKALYEAKSKGRNQVALYRPAKKKKWFTF